MVLTFWSKFRPERIHGVGHSSLLNCSSLPSRTVTDRADLSATACDPEGGSGAPVPLRVGARVGFKWPRSLVVPCSVVSAAGIPMSSASVSFREGKVLELTRFVCSVHRERPTASPPTDVVYLDVSSSGEEEAESGPLLNGSLEDTTRDKSVSYSGREAKADPDVRVADGGVEGYWRGKRMPWEKRRELRGQVVGRTENHWRISVKVI